MEGHPYNTREPMPDLDDDDRTAQYLSFTPKRAMASFENLVALANHQERLKQARKIIWRDRGEPITEVDDLWECARHAARGGLRAGTSGFWMRAGLNLILLLFRIRRAPRSVRMSLVRHAIFGQDSIRFAAMLGSFAALYKFILNALPLLAPPPPSPNDDMDIALDDASYTSEVSAPTPPDLEKGPGASTGKRRRTQRLSLSAEARLMYIRKQTRRWHAVVAGVIAGGVAVMFEKRARRVGIAQQLFVRGLQGSFNAFKTKRGLRIPHGDVLLFSLCSAQIMYAFLLRPDTIPRSYNTWIIQASKVQPLAVPINRQLFREGTFDLKDMEKLVDWKHTTLSNKTALQTRLASALAGDCGPPHAPCSAVHPWLDACVDVPLDRFVSVFTWMLPIYGALHFIPMLLFKRGLMMEKPLEMFMKAGWGTTRSAAFLGTFVVIYQTWICGRFNLYDYLYPHHGAPKAPAALKALLISRPAHWFNGLLCGLALFVEEKRRREELAMYVLPKGLESAWVTAKGRGWVFRTGQWGEALLCAMGMGMVMSTYQNDPQHLSGLVRRVLYQLVGPN